MKEGDIVCWQYEYDGHYHWSWVKAPYFLKPNLLCYWRIKKLKQ